MNANLALSVLLTLLLAACGSASARDRDQFAATAESPAADAAPAETSSQPFSEPYWDMLDADEWEAAREGHPRHAIGLPYDGSTDPAARHETPKDTPTSDCCDLAGCLTP